jgi:hypothetical protein
MPISNGEKEKILAWRISELERAGLDVLDAIAIARSDADLEQARQLVGKCHPNLLVKILT